MAWFLYVLMPRIPIAYRSGPKVTSRKRRVSQSTCSPQTAFCSARDTDPFLHPGLSGGQKARIALARALYARPDILILDDVFSALDKTTEEHIFQSLFGAKGLLNDKTVILATNAGTCVLTFSTQNMVASSDVKEITQFIDCLVPTTYWYWRTRPSSNRARSKS